MKSNYTKNGLAMYHVGGFWYTWDTCFACKQRRLVMEYTSQRHWCEPCLAHHPYHVRVDIWRMMQDGFAEMRLQRLLAPLTHLEAAL